MNQTTVEILSVENPVFKSYLIWTSILVLKMILMAPLTSLQRIRKMTFANPEDLTFANPEDLVSKKMKVKFDDPDVERVRRAHRNDLENILPFFTIGFLYCLINPEPWLAINLFRAVGIARIVHTLVYAVVVIPQPARALAFFAALAPTAYMALRVILYCL